MSIIANEKEKKSFSELLQQFDPDKTLVTNKLENDELQIEVTKQENLINIKTSDGFNGNYDISEDLGIVLNEVEKAYIYKFLRDYLNKSLDWGILTGVKPVKLYKKIKQLGFNPDKILKENFYLDDEKLKTLREINELQEPYLDNYSKNEHISLYIGIPICPERCTYCSFVSTILDKKRLLLTEYLKNLEVELIKTAKVIKDHNLIIDSIYIGGGTPSILNAEEAKKLIDIIKENFDLSNIKEFSFEAGRADTTNKELLMVLKNNGITRICLNPQTLNQETLDKINRNYKIEEFKSINQVARDLGFDNINMDLICGLEDESDQDFLYSLNEVLKLNPENITIHNLSVKKGSKLNELYGKEIRNYFDKEFYIKVKDILTQAGYVPYYLYRQKYTVGNGENVGYTKANYESLYNILMMAESQTIIGIGAGSSGKLYNKELDKFDRVFTVKDIRTYNERSEEIINKKIEQYNKFFKDLLHEE